MITKTEAGKRVVTPWGAGTVEHHTDGYAGELDYFLVTLDKPADYGVTQVHIKPADVVWEKPAQVSTGEGPEPRSIRFESETCGRCGGKGRKNDGGWGANHKGICYRCNGACVVDTANGYRARQAYNKMRDERLGTTWGELADGEVFKFEGKFYEKGAHPWLVLPESTPVHRHNGAATRAMWREIAKRYKGATLEY
ncbi:MULTISPECIES: hypothetical protein [unclassified Streptomyces]|uniref:hypothetical protein n=1 Tax=unclassified Streptomyces TaxID=2593676 RepID=UPI0004BF9225|nr:MULTISPECIES: hypothetical protein [unclassified Streptomyces]